MSDFDLGRLGIGVGFQEGPEFLLDLVEAEQSGFSTVWIAGGALPDLDAIGKVVRATSSIKVGSSIIAADRFNPELTATFYAGVESDEPGRLILGLGGAHGQSPLSALGEYLDQLEPAVPTDRLMLAALGPKMLELARDRTAGALPALITPEYTATARQTLGPDATLAVQQLAVVDNDVAQARDIARPTVESLLSMPAYAASARRMGFDDADIANVSDRLVDSLVPSGDPDAVAAAIHRQYDAGADHVAINLLNPGRVLDLWREVSKAV